MYSVPVISPFDLNDDLNAVYRGESALLTHVLRLASLQEKAAIACLNLRVQHHRQAIIDKDRARNNFLFLEVL